MKHHHETNRRTAGPASARRNHGSRGYTLLEVLLAVSILSIGILGVMALHVSAINSNGRAREIISGSVLLADQIERLISMDYDGHELAVGTTASNTENGYRIERTVAVTQIANLKRIDIAVIRDDRNGRRFTATYYKGNRH